MSPRSNRKTSAWSAVNFKKHLTSMSCKLEPAIWSRDTGQRIPCFDRCQLIITWMSNTKEVHSKPRLHVSLSTCYLKYGSHLGRLHRRRLRRRCRAYAPTNNTASHDNHEKINSWVSFRFPYEYGAPLGGPSGRRSSATKAASVLRHARLWKTYEQWNYFILTYHLHELEIVRRWPKQQRWYNYSCRSTTTIREKRKENFSRNL